MCMNKVFLEYKKSLDKKYLIRDNKKCFCLKKITTAYKLISVYL